MKKKRSSRSIGNGFSAYTVEGRRGFNPVYSEGPRHGSRLFLLKGLHTVVEAYMLDNPGKRLPSKQLATRFRTSANVIRSIVLMEASYPDYLAYKLQLPC